MAYLPITDELYHTDREGRVRLNGKLCQPEPSAPLDSESVLYIPSDSHRRYEISFPGKTWTLGSAVYHALMARRAHTAGVFEGNVYLWDVAAVLAICQGWGLRVGTLEGRELTVDDWGWEGKNREPFLIARPELFEQIAGSIRPRRES